MLCQFWCLCTNLACFGATCECFTIRLQPFKSYLLILICRKTAYNLSSLVTIWPTRWINRIEARFVVIRSGFHRYRFRQIDIWFSYRSFLCLQPLERGDAASRSLKVKLYQKLLIGYWDLRDHGNWRILFCSYSGLLPFRSSPVWSEYSKTLWSASLP